MSFAVDRIDHVEVFVTDIQRAVDWYHRVLGLNEELRFDPEPVMIGRGGNRLALFRVAEGGKMTLGDKRPHWRRVAWLVSGTGFDEAQHHLSRNGVDYEGPINYGPVSSIYFNDPDGNPLEITTENTVQGE